MFSGKNWANLTPRNKKKKQNKPTRGKKAGKSSKGLIFENSFKYKCSFFVVSGMLRNKMWGQF